MSRKLKITIQRKLKLIKDHYIDAFEEIRDLRGEKYSDHIIGPHITLEEAIGYTKLYVIKDKYGKENDYRYCRYQDGLDEVLEQPDFSPTNKKIVNLDLGCGPGVFSWAVRDHMIEKYGMIDSGLKLIGYDHAPSMIELAGLFRDHLPMGFNLEGYSEVDDIKEALRSKDFSNCDVIVTFGYVLVQTGGDPKARDAPKTMKNFAKIIESLLSRSGSCILIAVDSHSKNRWKHFRKACGLLKVALEGLNVKYDKYNLFADKSRSNMYARLTPK